MELENSVTFSIWGKEKKTFIHFPIIFFHRRNDPLFWNKICDSMRRFMKYFLYIHEVHRENSRVWRNRDQADQILNFPKIMMIVT